MIRQVILEIVKDSAIRPIKEGKFTNLTQENLSQLKVEKTKNPEFGDYAVNVSPLARFAKMPPAKIAQIIMDGIKSDDFEVSLVGGYINFKIKNNLLNKCLATIIDKNKDFGRNNFGNSQKVLVEYVSANPTGPLHIGHGRWAAVGSALSNILKFSGYDVTQEFYVNDVGNQINNLGKSLWLRVLQELKVDAPFPKEEEQGAKNYYPGEYLIEVAKNYLKENHEKAEYFYRQHTDPYKPSEEIIQNLSSYAKREMLQHQKELLNKFKVNFDSWYSEQELHEKGEVKVAIEKLKDLDKLYEQDNALWFKSSEYGDDQDRVIIKSDYSYTYLTADIAYHYDKLKRNFDKLINIWGADHHGYVARMKASIEALGYDPDSLEVLLGQLVNLIISGEQVRMGKRKKMLTLEDLIEEVGADATRFWMTMRSIDTTLDFYVDIAKACSDENPVYYVQYAHARASSILRTSTKQRINQDTGEVLPSEIEEEELRALLSNKNISLESIPSLWETDQEKEIESTRSLIIKLESFEDTVLASAKLRAPYIIAKYIQELSTAFHYFYTFSRVLNVKRDIMKARLCLVYSTRQVINNALSLLEVSAPESM